MPNCPLCFTALNTVRQREGIYFHCPGCGGRAVTVPQVRRVAGDKFATALLRQINTASTASSRGCPFCSRPMKQFRVPQPELLLDACKTCGAVWFDPAEFETLPEMAVESVSELQLRGREAIGLQRIEYLAKAEREVDPCPDEGWKQWLGVFGMPVELDPPPLARQPWLTWILAAVTTVVSLAALTQGHSVVLNFGLIPADLWRYGGATLLTSFFLHAGIIHLLGNMYFFLLVGDNVEDYLGRIRFALLLLAATVAGGLSHAFFDPRSEVPCIGASGGISGLMAFYALTFPHSRLAFFGRVGGFFCGFRWVQMPAWGVFVLWVLFQMVGAGMQLMRTGEVSALAHLGGAAVGVLFWVWQRRPVPASA